MQLFSLSQNFCWMNAPIQEPPLDDPFPGDRRGWNRPDLTAIERRKVVSFFLEKCSIVHGVLRPARNTTVAAANIFGIDRTTAAKIWKIASDNKSNPDVGYYTASPQRKGKCGRKQVYDPLILEHAIADLPRENRKSIRGVAGGLGVSTSVVFRMLKNKNLRRVSSSLKPMEYAAAQIDRLEDGTYSDFFRDSFDEIYVDEKWFEITEMTKNDYGIPHLGKQALERQGALFFAYRKKPSTKLLLVDLYREWIKIN